MDQTLSRAVHSACAHRPLTCIAVGGGTQLSLCFLVPAAVCLTQGPERTVYSCCSCFDPQTDVGNAIGGSPLHLGAEEAPGGTRKLVTCRLQWTGRWASFDGFGVFAKLESVAGVQELAFCSGLGQGLAKLWPVSQNPAPGLFLYNPRAKNGVCIFFKGC